MQRLYEPLLASFAQTNERFLSSVQHSTFSVSLEANLRSVIKDLKCLWAQRKEVNQGNFIVTPAAWPSRAFRKHALELFWSPGMTPSWYALVSQNPCKLLYIQFKLLPMRI
jgi:hypothetical protein